ncbi:hypothetical protein ACWCTE_37410, partial [Streptomyces sp. NPDC001774]
MAGDPRTATHLQVRVVEYTVTGTGKEAGLFRLVATILDPDDLTAVDLAAAYHERWEYEVSLKEIETQVLRPGSGLR